MRLNKVFTYSVLKFLVFNIINDSNNSTNSYFKLSNDLAKSILQSKGLVNFIAYSPNVR